MYKIDYFMKRVERSDGAVGDISDSDPLWSEYLEWLGQGNSPEVVTINREPIVVTPVQARIALAQAGLLSSVESAIAKMPETSSSRIAWEYALEFREDSPTLIKMCADLGLNRQQTTALFEAAKGIQV